MMLSANISSPVDESISRKPESILEKIVFIDLALRSGIHSILKCLNKRGVTLFLPPPGGAQAHTKVVF